MLTILRNIEPYQKHETRARLQLVLPTPAAVDEQMLVIEQCHIDTKLPWPDIARPYLHIILAGYTLTAERLLQLLEWSKRLIVPFETFVCYYTLPYLLQGPHCLTKDLERIFTAAA